jgi:hypothetical protein
VRLLEECFSRLHRNIHHTALPHSTLDYLSPVEFEVKVELA